MAKKNTNTVQKIVDAYMKHVLEHNAKPISVYVFVTSLEIKEGDFYKHFASFEALEQEVFAMFFENTHKLLSKDEDFKSYDAKNKLLSFYFTFFEVLTANRSFVNYALHGSAKRLTGIPALSKLKHHFQDFYESLEIEKMDLKIERLEKVREKGMKEMAWNQLLFTMKFWLDDTSQGFEKTDIFIEKSINASFELMHIQPIESLIDLGKFLVKERMNTRA